MDFKVENFSKEGKQRVKEYISNSIEETFHIAKDVAGRIEAPAIILLFGDLGAGKTHFVKGFAKAIGCEEIVTSPTFTIMNEYLGGKFPIYHFDMYRLSSAEDGRNLGFEEYFDLKNLNGISIVEWPENVEGLFPNDVIKITISKGGKENERIILIKGDIC